MMIRRPKGLGRGLDALLGETGAAVEAPPGSPHVLPLAQLRPGRYQPRTKMDPEALSELADSIRAQGVIQPLLVRPLGEASGASVLRSSRVWTKSRCW
jgi:ParB family chromosome partitioning protein